MFKWYPIAAVAAIGVLMSGCSRLGQPTEPIVPCRFASLPTNGWVERERMKLLLPRAFQRDSTQMFIHGGTMWRDGSRSVSISGGHWSRDSFTGYGSPNVIAFGECWETINGVSVLLVGGWHKVTKRYFVGSIWDPHEGVGSLKIDGISGDQADIALFVTAIRSAALR